MPIYKRNNKYYAKVNYKQDGKYKSIQSKYVDTKREAKEEEVLLLAKVKTAKKDITFKDAYKELMVVKENKGVHPRTLKKIGNAFTSLGDFVDKNISQIHQDDIDRLRERLMENYQEITIKQTLSFTKQIINYGSQKYNIKVEYLDTSLPKKIQPKKKLDFYTYDEFAKFYDCIEDKVYKTLFDLLFFNGLRISEARGLTFNDFDGKSISINKQYYKAQGLSDRLKTNNSYRTLPLNKRLVEEFEELRTYYSSFPHFTAEWFIFGGIKPFAETSIRFAMRKAVAKAKVKEIRLHDFRHSCASYYIHKNFQIHLIAELLGDNINTVYATYYHLYKDDLAEMINSAEIRG